MNLKEANKNCHCNLSNRAIRFLIDQGIFPEEDKELTKEDMDKLCTVWLFSSVGVEKEKILEYFGSDNLKKIAILKKIRAKLLDDIHAEQKCLDKVDRIINAIQKS